MNPRSSERGHTRGGTLNRRLRALAVVAFGLALLPGAIAVDTSPAPSTPVVATRLDPVPPLRAEKPTRDEQINLNARRRVAERPEHFQCLALDGSMLTEHNAIPDANVTATITFDASNGHYAVVAVDSKQIIIGYETIYRHSKYADKTFVIDHYTWSFGPGVEPYAVFIRSVDADGNVYWGNYSPTRNKQGAYQASLYRDGDTATVYIVATDPKSALDTCEQGNDLPAEMWDGVARLH